MGKGTFGIVYAAVLKTNTNLKFAIKVISDWDYINIEKLSVQILIRLVHTNIVRVIEEFYDDKTNDLCSRR